MCQFFIHTNLHRSYPLNQLFCPANRYNDHTLGSGDGGYLYVKATDSDGIGLYNAGPYLLESAIHKGIDYVQFWYYMYGEDIGTLAFDVSSDGGITWSTAWSIAGNQGRGWFLQTISLPKDATTIRFTGTTGLGEKGDMCIDDFYASTMPAPSVLPTPAPTGTPAPSSPTPLPSPSPTQTMSPTTAPLACDFETDLCSFSNSGDYAWTRHTGETPSSPGTGP